MKLNQEKAPNLKKELISHERLLADFNADWTKYQITGLVGFAGEGQRLFLPDIGVINS